MILFIIIFKAIADRPQAMKKLCSTDDTPRQTLFAYILWVLEVGKCLTP